MHLLCRCGKAWRWPDGAQFEDCACPDCAAPLKPVDAPAPPGELPFAADVRVLLEQKRALRDEMRVRDMTIRRLKVQLKTLQDAFEKSQDQAPELKGLKQSAAFNGPLALPDDRVF
jgi:hypothetical protein